MPKPGNRSGQVHVGSSSAEGRELLHVVEAALVLSEGSNVLPEQLPASLRNSKPAPPAGPSAQDASLPTLEEAERAYIRLAIEASHGHRGKVEGPAGFERSRWKIVQLLAEGNDREVARFAYQAHHL